MRRATRLRRLKTVLRPRAEASLLDLLVSSHPLHRLAKAAWERLRSVSQGRLAFVIECIPSGTGSVLDIGSGEGWLIGEHLKDIPMRMGVDTDTKILARAKERYPDCRFDTIDGGLLPLPDASFDVAVLAEVLEHVGDSNKVRVVSEALRVVKPGGRLVITVPHKGIFSFVDPLDYKRRFPRLYAHYRRYSGHEPLTPPEIGHKHIDLDQILALLQGRGRVDVVRYAGIFSVLSQGTLLAALVLPGVPRSVVLRAGRFQAWEMGLPAPRWLASGMRLLVTRLA